jgi:hypothetical protein
MADRCLEDGAWENRLLRKVKKTNPLSYKAKKTNISVFLDVMPCNLVNRSISEESSTSIFRVDGSSNLLRNICNNLTDWRVSFLRDIIPCSPLKVNRRSGGSCRLRNVGWFSTDYTALYRRR